VHDSTGGFRAYRATTLSKIGIEDVTSQGYCFQVDLTLRTVRCGLRVAEVPITFVERTHGASKMNRDIMVEAFMKLTQWGLERRLGRFTRRG
jgi:dolichol-phosphate mannosyltransferase